MKEFFFFLCVLFLSILHGQKSNTSNFEIKRIDVALNGGSKTVQSRVAIASDGFLWYTTNGAIVKDYGDSSVLFSFNRDDLLNVLVTDILEDDRVIVWVATSYGIVRLNPETGIVKWIEWKLPDRNENGFILDISLNKLGRLIATARGGFLLEYIEEEDTFNSYQIPDGMYLPPKEMDDKAYFLPYIEEVLEDGSIILLQKERFLRLKNGEIDMLADFTNHSLIRKHDFLQLVDDGLLFPSGESGMYTFNGQTFFIEYVPAIDKQIIQFPSRDFTLIKNDNVNISNLDYAIAFYFQGEKQLHFGYIDQSTKTFVTSPDVIGFDYPVIDYGYKDDSSLYMVSPPHVYKLRRQNNYFKKYLSRDKLSSDDKNIVSTRKFARSPSNKVYLATYNGVYNLDEVEYDNSEASIKLDTLSENLFYNSWRAIYMENDSILWNAGESNKVLRLNLKDTTATYYVIKDKNVSSNTIFSDIAKSPLDDDLYFASGTGLYKLDTVRDEIVGAHTISKDISLKNKSVRSLSFIADSIMTVSVDNVGVYIKNLRSGQIKKLSADDEETSLASNIVFFVHSSMDGKYHMGTDKGLTIWDPLVDETVTYTTDDGLSNNIIVGALEREDMIVYSTYNGLISYDKEDDWFYNYYEKDGLPDNEFNQTSFYKKNDSAFYFGGINGYTKLNPDRLPNRKVTPIIKPIGAEYYSKTDDTLVKTTSNLEKSLRQITLPYDNTYLNLSFAVSDNFAPEDAQITYRIDGLSNTWYNLDNQKDLRLYGMAPGKYTLFVRGEDSSNNPTENTLVIPIKISQVFYKQWWFLLLTALIITVMFLWWSRFKRRRFKEKIEQQRQVDKLESKALRAQMNPHFMFNALNGLQSIMILKGERAANKYLGSFSKLLRSTLDMSNSDKVSLQSEIDYLSAYTNLEIMRQSEGLEISIRKDPEYMNTEDIMIPCMLLQPVIENAILHGLAPKKKGVRKLDILFKDDDDELTVIIEDTGIGRKAAEERKQKFRKGHKSHATRILKERIDIINHYTDKNVNFTITDLYDGEIATGTSVMIKLPIN